MLAKHHGRGRRVSHLEDKDAEAELLLHCTMLQLILIKVLQLNLQFQVLP